MSPRLERAALPKLLAHPAYRRHAKTEKFGNLASALASLVELENPPPHRDRNGSHGPTLSHNHVSVKLHHLWKCSKRCVELAAKDATEHRDGKKEIVAWFDPAGVIGGQSTGWHQAMDMRVGRELLTPGMQNAAEADFRTEVLGIAGHFEKSFRTGAKQEIVEDFLVLQDQGGQRTRKREDHMECAGINRSGVEDERALRVRSNDPLGPEFGAGSLRGAQRSINRGIGGQGIELRKVAIRAPTRFHEAEGNMDR